jgi:hypothetical protein
MLSTTEWVSEWSPDTGKSWVSGNGGQVFAFAFDSPIMAVRSLPRAVLRKGLLLPLRTGATFSFVDPDLIYELPMLRR